MPDRLFGRDQDGGHARFSLVAVVTDTAGQKHSTGESRVVTADPIELDVLAEGGSLVGGLANKIYVFASYADGRPAQVTLVVHGLNRGNRHQPTGRGLVRTDSGTAAEQVGVTVKATDAEGRVGRKNVQLTCGRYEGDFLVRPDKAVYEGGETMVSKPSAAASNRCSST